MFHIFTGTHSLHYHYLALSEPGPGLPQFLAVGYVDDQAFIHYDSRVDRAKPQAPWMAAVDTQYWETETQKQRAWAKVQQVETWTVMGYHNQSSGASEAPATPHPPSFILCMLTLWGAMPFQLGTEVTPLSP